MSRGALNVNTIAARPVFRDGQLVDLQPHEKNRAKDLIADLMIATNGATARFLVDKGFPSIRRFLQAPRRWDRIELQVLKAAGAYLLHDRIGDVFDALVTGAAAKGTFVRISSPLLEGRVVRGFEGLDVGDTARVRLVAVDAEKSFIDFERA
ncbi:RNB domain-containing ribonuclease [Polaromonas sp.]|uniref:RNB domain-containing ribonuclease n=1 Tax=Polaromonas sp. TaxID=1869339 RepID=UPI003521B418